MSADDGRPLIYSPAVYAAARSWADSMPSQTGGFDDMAPHRKAQLLMRMDQALRAASLISAETAAARPDLTGLVVTVAADRLDPLPAIAARRFDTPTVQVTVKLDQSVRMGIGQRVGLRFER